MSSAIQNNVNPKPSEPTKPPEAELPSWSLWGTLSAAIAAQACCGLPWLLLTLGFSSSTVAYLELLKPWRPLFVSAAFGFLLAGIFHIWRTRQPGYVCKVKTKN